MFALRIQLGAFLLRSVASSFLVKISLALSLSQVLLRLLVYAGRRRAQVGQRLRFSAWHLCKTPGLEVVSG